MRTMIKSAVFGIGAAAVVASAQPAKAQSTTLEMAYMPIVPCAQLFVMEGMGWTKEAGINLKLTRFPNGPAIVQAIASGKMDMMCFGVGPAMVAKAKGINIRVVAPGIVEQIAVVAQGDIVQYFNKYGAKDGLRKFAKDKGRKPKLASFPKGSVPDTVTRHWLVKELGMDVNEVELVGMGAARVQQALLSRSVDAAGILEPVLSIVESRPEGAKVVARSKDMMPGHPGSTIAVREPIIEKHRAAIVKYIELHDRATKLLKENPEAAAPHVKNFVAKGLVPQEIILRALKTPSANFRSNPEDIIESSKYMQTFQKDFKIHNRKVTTKELFDTSIYKEATAK